MAGAAPATAWASGGGGGVVVSTGATATHVLQCSFQTSRWHEALQKYAALHLPHRRNPSKDASQFKHRFSSSSSESAIGCGRRYRTRRKATKFFRLGLFVFVSIFENRTCHTNLPSCSWNRSLRDQTASVRGVREFASDVRRSRDNWGVEHVRAKRRARVSRASVADLVCYVIFFSTARSLAHLLTATRARRVVSVITPRRHP